MLIFEARSHLPEASQHRHPTIPHHRRPPLHPSEAGTLATTAGIVLVQDDSHLDHDDTHTVVRAVYRTDTCRPPHTPEASPPRGCEEPGTDQLQLPFLGGPDSKKSPPYPGDADSQGERGFLMNEANTAQGIRALRRQRRLSQEQLAELAGLSVTTIKKAEAGRGYVSGRTLHAIAQALEVSTQDLYDTKPTVPNLRDEGDQRSLAAIRAAISPPVGLDGNPVVNCPSQPVTLSGISQEIARIDRDYQADRYGEVASALPQLLHSAHQAVAELDSSEAYRVRAQAYQAASRYLIQNRQLDLALTALASSIRDAAHVGDQTLAAVAINGQGWALMRQGRLEEAERVCVATADEIEPRVSTASADELAAWGNLLFRAGAAAIRNNHHDRAWDLLRVAASAAAALGREHISWGSIGPMTIALKSAEFQLVVGKPDLMLREAERLPDARKVGRVTPLNWNRHRLDKAEALALLGEPEQAIGELTGVMQAAPEWLRRQQQAYRTVSTIVAKRPRTLSPEMATLAAHLGVAA